MNSAIKFAFVNAYGFKEHIAVWISRSLRNGTYDFIFVAETWFRDLDGILFSHCDYICHTPRYNELRSIYGLALFGSPIMRNSQYQVAVLNPFAILLSVADLTVVGVYYPPSLRWYRVESYLPTGSIDALIGDINCYYNGAWGARHSSPVDRVKSIDDFALTNNLQHLPPGAGICANANHAFASRMCRPTLVYEPTKDVIATDHAYWLLLSLIPSFYHCAQSTLSPLPLRLCQRAIVMYPTYATTLLSKTYAIHSGAVASALSKLSPLMASSDLGEKQAAIDFAHAIILLAIESTATAVLGTYSPRNVYSQPQPVIAHSSSASMNPADEAIAMFRKAKDRNSLNQFVPLMPRPGAASVEEDVLDYYDDVFGPSSATDDGIVLDSTTTAFTDELGGLYSADSVAKTIEQLQNNKAGGGHDLVQARLLKCLINTELPAQLAVLYKHCCKLAVTPTEWNVARITLVPKESGADTVDRRRPIALTPVLRRIFELGLHMVMHSSAEQFGIGRLLHATQAGFREDISMVPHSLVSADLFHLPAPFARLSRIYIDLRQAYDHVLLAILIACLQSRGISAQLLLLVQALFCDVEVDFVINGGVSSRIKCQRGLLQGSHLSPLLFDFYIDELARALATTASDNVPAALLYADDIQLLPRSAKHAREMLAIVDNWCARSGMEVNVKKSGVLGPLFDMDSYFLGGQPLPLVQSYTYLGLPTTAAGIDWATYIDRLVTKAKRALWFVMSTCKHADIPVRLCLFRTFVRSTWENAFALMAASRNQSFLMKLVRQLQEVQEKALVWILLTKNGVSVAHSVCGILPVEERTKVLAAMFNNQLVKLAPDSPSRILYEALHTANIESISTRARAARLFEWWVALGSDQTSLHADLRWWTQNYFSTFVGNKLVRGILPPSRHKNSLADISVRLPAKGDPDRLLLAWRMNRYKKRVTCECGKQFKRACIERCFSDLTADVPADYDLRGLSKMDVLISISVDKALIALAELEKRLTRATQAAALQ